MKKFSSSSSPCLNLIELELIFWRSSFPHDSFAKLESIRRNIKIKISFFRYFLLIFFEQIIHRTTLSFVVLPVYYIGETFDGDAAEVQEKQKKTATWKDFSKSNWEYTTNRWRADK